MNFNYVKYALEVKRTGSITKAAEALFMGQPNLSKAIRELETSLGIRLFRRTPGGVVTTAEGERFLNEAEKLLFQITELEKHCRNNNGGMRLVMPRLEYAVCAFETKPESTLAFASSSEVMQKVGKGEYTIGLVRYLDADEAVFTSVLESMGLKHEKVRSAEYSSQDGDVITVHDSVVYVQDHKLSEDEYAWMQRIKRL